MFNKKKLCAQELTNSGDSYNKSLDDLLAKKIPFHKKLKRILQLLTKQEKIYKRAYELTLNEQERYFASNPNSSLNILLKLANVHSSLQEYDPNKTQHLEQRIQYLEKAHAIIKKDSKICFNNGRLTLFELGMAYAINRDTKKMKEVLNEFTVLDRIYQEESQFIKT